jgi:hypothetical protein
MPLKYSTEHLSSFPTGVEQSTSIDQGALRDTASWSPSGGWPPIAGGSGEARRSRKTEGEESRPEPLFPLGQVVATPGALDALRDAEQDPLELLTRHITGDWGQLCEEDKEENELSLRQGFRLLSAYELSTGVKLWVITERDRSATTLLLPSDY